MGLFSGRKRKQRLQEAGVEETGQVVSVKDTGMTINDNPRVVLTLQVTPADGSPASELDEDQMNAWMAALNELRLVLGTRLDVSEDEDLGANLDTDNELAPAYALYGYLGWLQDEVVTALAGW